MRHRGAHLARLIKNTQGAFGPQLVELLKQLALLFSNLAGRVTD